MHNNLPFKPLLITVALASLFPMGVASASTYGIHANSQDLIIEDQRKLFKNPCSQAELNKIVPFGFSLQRQKMVFFCHQNSIILLC